MKRLIVLMCFLCLPVYAADLVTPDSWSQHYTESGVKASTDGIQVQDGTLKIGVTLRDVVRLFDNDNDNNLYLYLRGQLLDMSVGNGTLTATVNMRGATDTSTGKIRDKGYHFFYESMDASRDGDKWDYRLYQGNIVLDQVISYTKLTLGRFYTDHLTDMRIDGGDLVIGTDDYKGFIFYGFPASFFDTSYDSQVLGGGFDLRPLTGYAPAQSFRLRGEIMKFFDDSDMDADTLAWKLRADLDYGLFDMLEGSVYGSFGMLEDAWLYEIGSYGTFMLTGTDYDIWFNGQYDRNDDDVNVFISNFDYVSGPTAQHTQFGINLMQPVNDKFAASIGFETQYNFDVYYGDRDYYRGLLGLHFSDLFQNNYISLVGEYWHVPADGGYKKNDKFYVSGKISQIISESFDIWAGASIMSYKYYLREFDTYNNTTIENRKLDNSVYVLYVGAAFRPVENMTVQADYTYENSDVIKDFDSDRNSISTVAMSVNYNF